MRMASGETRHHEGRALGREGRASVAVRDSSHGPRREATSVALRGNHLRGPDFAV